MTREFDMNPCPDMEPLLNELLDNELDASQHALISEHLVHCGLCSSHYRELQRLDALLATASVGPSETLGAAVADMPRRARRRTISRLVFASAAAVALIAAGLWLSFSPAAAQPVSDSFASLQLIHRVQESASARRLTPANGTCDC